MLALSTDPDEVEGRPLDLERVWLERGMTGMIWGEDGRRVQVTCVTGKQ